MPIVVCSEGSDQRNTNEMNKGIHRRRQKELVREWSNINLLLYYYFGSKNMDCKWKDFGHIIIIRRLCFKCDFIIIHIFMGNGSLSFIKGISMDASKRICLGWRHMQSWPEYEQRRHYVNQMLYHPKQPQWELLYKILTLHSLHLHCGLF